jgi:hypothetical protein
MRASSSAHREHVVQNEGIHTPRVLRTDTHAVSVPRAGLPAGRKGVKFARLVDECEGCRRVPMPSTVVVSVATLLRRSFKFDTSSCLANASSQSQRERAAPQRRRSKAEHQQLHLQHLQHFLSRVVVRHATRAGVWRGAPTVCSQNSQNTVAKYSAHALHHSLLLSRVESTNARVGHFPSKITNRKLYINYTISPPALPSSGIEPEQLVRR